MKLYRKKPAKRELLGFNNKQNVIGFDHETQEITITFQSIKDPKDVNKGFTVTLTVDEALFLAGCGINWIKKNP